MGISGTGVGLATLGALMVYSGLTKQSLPAAIRSIGTGAPTPVVAKTISAASTSASAVNAAAVTVGGGLPGLPGAAYAFSGDKYSQAKRWLTGYSDCSSFVGKALKALGITPPGASTTLSYLSSPQWRQISVTQAGAGDLLCNSTHVVIVINPGTAIGQENPSRNVQVGSFADLMDGTGAYVCLRYQGGASTSSLAV